jgi:regulator of cell morphogenesis and NO signaling
MKTTQLTGELDFADVLKKSGMDVSDSSNKTLKDAGHEVGANGEQLKNVLQKTTIIKTTASQEFHTLDINSLIDYIINAHHSYAKINAVIIYDLTQKLAYKHCENHPELTKLVTKTFLFLHDLLNHMMIEEEILFPNIKQLIKNRSLSGKAIYTTFGLIRESVKLLEKQHSVEKEDLKVLRKLSNNYKVSEYPFNSCNYLFEKMQEFENDWLVHIDIENNILFPKAIVLDEALE